MEQSAPKVIIPGPGKTFWFGAGIFWLFIFAEVFDEVRHGHENLFLLFGAPFWLGACAVAMAAGRLLWHLFPRLSLRPSHSSTTQLPVLIGVFGGFAAAYAWGKSPWFTLFYNSCKWMLVLLIAGAALGVVFKRGGAFGLASSLLRTGCCAAVAILVFFLLALVFVREDIWRGTWMLAALGLPFTVAVALFDCAYRTPLGEAICE